MQDSIFNLLTEEHWGRNALKWNYFARCKATVAGEMDFPPHRLCSTVGVHDNEESATRRCEDSLPRATVDCADNAGAAGAPTTGSGRAGCPEGWAVVEFFTRPESWSRCRFRPCRFSTSCTSPAANEWKSQQDSTLPAGPGRPAGAFVRGAGSVIIRNPNNHWVRRSPKPSLRAIVDIAARHGAR